MPDQLPDLTNHNSFFSDVMKANSELYGKLKDVKTSTGVTLGQCLKSPDGPVRPGVILGLRVGPVRSEEIFLECCILLYFIKLF